MAAQNYKIVLIEGNKNTYLDSQNLETLFKALGVGTSNIQITDDSGVLSVAAKLKCTDATDATHVSTKGQLDTTASGLQSQITTNADNITTLNSNVDNLFIEEHFTATAGQTEFTVAGEFLATDVLEVLVDGREQREGASYSYVRDAGTNKITFTSGITLDSWVKIRVYKFTSI